MENKINIAEILKDCPKGTKLYSPLVGECTLEHIHSELKKILISTSDGTTLTFNNNGTYFQMDNSECLLFPSKDQRDWSKFQRPFKDGDIVATNSGHWIGITTGGTYNESIPTYCIIDPNDSLRLYFDKPKSWSFNRLATEEEKEKLFQAIKANGYKWNLETKTLEKLVEPRFKVGDRIKAICNNNQYDIKELTDTHYTLVEVKYKFKYTEPISEDKKWELVPNKFDITTLVPFESRVLVRDDGYSLWQPSLWGLYDKEHKFPYVTVGCRYKQCIPYEENEHLVGTTNDCNEYYKTW